VTTKKKMRKFNHLAGEISHFAPDTHEKVIELKKLGKELGYSDEKINKIRNEQWLYRYKSQQEQKNQHQKKQEIIKMFM